MSLLGFDAIGRWALGQNPNRATTLFATAGSFAATGSAATFKISEVTLKGIYLETGNAAIFTTKLGALSGSYVFTGFAANVTILEGEGPATYIVTGYPATLTRDFVNWLPSSDLAPPAWMQEGAPSNIWTPAAPLSGSWGASAAPSSVWTPATPIAPVWTPEFTEPT